MPPPSFWIGTSWKMHKTLAEALAFARTLAAADADRDPRIQRFVIPSFTAVREVSTALTGSSVKVGAQNMHWADEGAWTHQQHQSLTITALSQGTQLTGLVGLVASNDQIPNAFAPLYFDSAGCRKLPIL